MFFSIEGRHKVGHPHNPILFGNASQLLTEKRFERRRVKLPGLTKHPTPQQRAPGFLLAGLKTPAKRIVRSKSYPFALPCSRFKCGKYRRQIVAAFIIAIENDRSSILRQKNGMTSLSNNAKRPSIMISVQS